MRWLRLATISVIAVAMLALAAVASSAAGSSTDLRAQVGTTGKGLHARIHLQITINGKTLFKRIVRSRFCPPGCITAPLGAGKSPLRVLDLDSEGVPDVVLGLFSGGAHCCFVDQVYSLDPGTMTFVRTEHDFADAGARLQDLNGDHQIEFLSADSDIAEAGFTDFADSGAPIQIWAYAGRSFDNVTRQYPSRIKADAARWLRQFKDQHGNGRGLIAAWAADEDLLGNSALVTTTLAAERRAGKLGVPEGFGGPSPTRFISQLQSLLHKLGYTH